MKITLVIFSIIGIINAAFIWVMIREGRKGDDDSGIDAKVFMEKYNDMKSRRE